MLRFRPKSADLGPVIDFFAVSEVIDAALAPGNFFAAPDLHLNWIAARSETIPWEIFRGRLLDVWQTRLQKTFLSWHVSQADATESTISTKLDVHARQIHVTRGLLAYAWEGYDAGGAIESRETVKWLRELVGTIDLADFDDLENLRDELICLIWQSVVGTSRLPLTSVEAPLPAFAFGQLSYVHRPTAGDRASDSWAAFLVAGLQPTHAWNENVKLVEFTLRRIEPAQLPRLAEFLGNSWLRESLPRLFRSMFNDVSLSPHTRFTANALALVAALADRGALSADQQVDFLGHLLRQLGRHLTAYDLVTFHHRGANYPDALLLDLALRQYIRVIETAPGRFTDETEEARLRRRALRQACLARRRYEGHLVPDLPTSPGENARVLPASHPRLPEEQLTQTHRRRRVLYAGESLAGVLSECARRVVAKSVADLMHFDERVEMGLGVFIDRPLGYAKAVGEPDLTPLLAHEAFSPSLARRRWQELKELCDEHSLAYDPAALDPLFENGLGPAGLPHKEVAECPRPAAALCDVRKVAADFVILRTLPKGMLALLDRLAPLQARYRLPFITDGRCRWCVQALDEAKVPRLMIYDDRQRRRLEMAVDASQGFRTRAGVELPRAGLQILCVWEDAEDGNGLIRREPVDLRV